MRSAGGNSVTGYASLGVFLPRLPKGLPSSLGFSNKARDMATKQQVLALLEKGLTPQQIARKLKCSDAYVRATRQRATPDGLEKARKWQREKMRRIYATPKSRAAFYAYRRGERGWPLAGVDYPSSR